MINVFSARCGEILQEMLAETAGSIIIRTDAEGFIEEASRGIEALGLRLSEMLFKPHLADLAVAEHANALRDFHRQAICGLAPTDRFEFPIAGQSAEPSWYALSLRPAPNDDGQITGTLGLLRSIDGRRSLESEVAAAAMTDAVTGLANAQAFQAMLAQRMLRGVDGAIALFEIDRFSAFKLKFGQAMAGEVLWAFGRFLENILPAGHILARLDGDRFAAIIPDCQRVEALALVQDVIVTFAGLSQSFRRKGARLTASAGMAGLSGSPDTVLAQAERALVVARALGGQRAEFRDATPSPPAKLTGT